MSEERNILYRVTFHQDGKLYQVYARYISEETLVGFLEIDELIFGEPESSGIVIDTGEEKLRSEFKDVKRSYIPTHLILRVDEVTQHGISTIKNSSQSGNVSQFPSSFKTPISKGDVS